MKKHTPLLFLCLLMTGCVDEQQEPPTSQALSAMKDAAEAPFISVTDGAESGEVVTFLDSPALQDGPGEIDEDVDTEFQTTESGLQYRILRESDGAKPTASDGVKVNYRGWLDNGKKFDGCYGDEPISFPLSGVIPGWTEGLQLIGTGGMIELWIPSELGYGTKGFANSIPPNSTLHFVVELLEVQ